jgi:hypothetical protein
MKTEKEKETPATQASPDLSGVSQPGHPTKEEIREALKPPVTALNPETIGFINASISAAVTSAMASMGPVLEKIALTPEKLAEAEALRRAPDPAQAEREAREKKLQHLEMAENRDRLQKVRENCPHTYNSGQASINVVSNFPDRQMRGICVVCGEWFNPREWRIGPPTKDEPRGVAYIADAHPQYGRVLQRAAQLGMLG